MFEQTQCSQKVVVCTIYQKVDIDPKYYTGMVGLMEYFGKEVSPIISDCMKQDKELVSKFIIRLVIDNKGTVIDATIQDDELTVDCKAQLRSKLLTMSGWTPGQMKTKTVCSYYNWIISCIKWG